MMALWIAFGAGLVIMGTLAALFVRGASRGR